MASTAPAKSQPLHNFNLPNLKWNKDGHSGGNHKRRRSINSPSRRLNTSSASPVRHLPLRDSVSATPLRLQSPLGDSVAPSSRESPVHGDYLMKQSPIRGESSRPSSIREWTKHTNSMVGGGSERLSSSRGEAVGDSPTRDLPLESEALGKSECALIEHQRNHSRNSAFDSTGNGVYSSTSEEKLEKKSKATTEVDVAGIKRSKILIKIPCKNSKLEEENPQDEPLKIENNGEHGENDKVQEEGKINNNIDEETKIWNLRPRKPISKKKNVTVGAEKGNVSGMPEKNKTQPPLMKAKQSGEKEGNCSRGGGGEKKGDGGEKKEKRKLSISVALSKQEIEEDIYSLTGSKLARRPKKRAKNIQKQLDCVFPGLWLVSITPDSYKQKQQFANTQKHFLAARS